MSIKKQYLFDAIAYLVIVVLAGYLVITIVNGLNERKELRDKVSQLQHALSHSTIDLLRDTISGQREVATQPPVIIDKTDYKRLEADKKLISELKLKIEQVESENRSLLATKGQVVLKTATDSDSVLHYHDRWVDFSYQVAPRILDYAVRDSVTTIVSRQYKHRFLWWRWGTKGYTVHIVSHNPNSTVEYNRYIMVEH